MTQLLRVSLAGAALSLLVGCTQPVATPPAQTATTPSAAPTSPAPAVAKRGTIVFDMGHGEIFGADNTTQLGQSQAVARMQDAGFEVVVNQGSITATDLADASGLIVAGPMRPLLDEEYAAITDFVEQGGTVLLTIHVPFPVLKVPAHWGLPVGTEVMMSNTALSPADPSAFVASQIDSSPITEGVSRVVVVSGWPVSSASKKSTVVVKTREDTWLSPAQGQPAAAPQTGSFGVIGIARIGDGHVIVSGDDAVFANIALGQADNARLLDNIIRMMSEMADV